MNYINPFKLLGIEEDNFGNYQRGDIKREKNRLLNEIDLCDGKIRYLENEIHLNKNDLFKLCDELDDDEKRFFHIKVLKNPFLFDFISTGSLKKIELYTTEEIYSSPFLNFIAPYFSVNFNNALIKAINENDKKIIKKIIDLEYLIENNFLDISYKSVMIYYKDKCKEIDQLIDSIEKGNLIRVETISIIPNITILNMMPAYFDNVRKEIALAINNMAIIINNKLQNYGTAYILSESALEISVDDLTFQKLKNNNEIFDNNLQSESDSGYAQQEWIKIKSVIKPALPLIFILLTVFLISSTESFVKKDNYEKQKSDIIHKQENPVTISNPRLNQQIHFNQKNDLAIEIEDDKSELESIDSLLTKQKDLINKLEIKIVSMEKQIDEAKIKADYDLLNDSEIDIVNDKIKKYNSLFETYSKAINDYNANVKIYEKKRIAYNNKIERYNNMR